MEISAPVEMATLIDALTVDRRAIERVARHAYRAPNHHFAEWTRRIWHHAMARATAMRLLALRVPTRTLVDPMMAYSAGLLADVGAPYLLRWWAEGVFGSPTLEAATVERISASVRLHHEAAGAALLTNWGFDPFTVHLARNHHVERPCYENPYWVLAVISEILARTAAADPDLHYGTPLSAEVREACCASARVSPAELRRLVTQVNVDFQALRARMEDGADNDNTSELS